jgi:PTH1 family peptidyl-tRNA hydrolase
MKGQADPEMRVPPLPVRLIVGLGNPGHEYAGNRHNVGHWVINRLAKRHGISMKAGKSASTGEGEIDGHHFALAKPRTFVNESGEAVWKVIKKQELDDASELLVVYDELDLPVARLRLRTRGGHAGQRGLRSIVEAVGSDAFPRLRIGIGRPVVSGAPSYDPAEVANYVLSDPPPDEKLQLEAAVDRAVKGIEVAVSQGIEAAMRYIN